MTKEISKDVIAKVFFSHYGCDYYFRGFPHVYKVGECHTFKLAWESNFKDCQLILSDLSDISDADVETCWKFGGKTMNSSYYNKKGAIVNLEFDGLTPEHIIAIIDFLRSRSYMLPAHGITDLFEAGIAVRKNKEV